MTSVDAPVTSIDAPAPRVYTTLITSTWSMPGQDWGNFCAIQPITQEMWIDSFRLGSATDPTNDHQLLYVTSTPPASCAPQLDDTDSIIYGAGDAGGSGNPLQEVDLPANMAVHLLPGTSLVLNSHIDNSAPGTTTVNGESVIEAHAIENPNPAQLTAVDMVLAGDAQLDVPANMPAPPAQNSLYQVTGTCYPTAMASEQWHIVMLWPHMHQSGRVATVSIEHAGASTTILNDSNYSISTDSYYVPVANGLVDTGDELNVECSLTNQHNFALDQDGETMPDSQGGALCWTGVYKWPAGYNQNVTSPYGCVVGHSQ